MTTKPALSLLIMLVGWFGMDDVFAETEVVIQPVSASGAHTIIGSDIFLPSGPQRVRLEFQIAGWGERQLKTVQVMLNSQGFENGAAPLEHSVVPCPGNNSTGHSFCAQTLEAGSRCEVGCDFGSTNDCLCESGFQNRNRTDFVGYGVNYVAAADTSTPDYRMGITTSPPDYVIDSGVPKYVGTMFIDVPAGAQGTYTLGFIATNTFMHEFGFPVQAIPIDLHTPARIIMDEPIPLGSRYVLFDPDEPGEQTAVRVTLASLYHPEPPVAPGEDRDFSALEGHVRWLGPPEPFPNNAPESTFLAAALQCTPFFANWGAMGIIQVYGDTVIPSSVYRIHQVPIACKDDPDDPTCFGPEQIVQTGQWGDAAPPFAQSDQAAQPDAADLAEIVDAFRGLTDAAPKSRTHLFGMVPNPLSDVSFLDVDLAVDAVRGKAYPYPVPLSCP